MSLKYEPASLKIIPDSGTPVQSLNNSWSASRPEKHSLRRASSSTYLTPLRRSSSGESLHALEAGVLGKAHRGSAPAHSFPLPGSLSGLTSSGGLTNLSSSGQTALQPNLSNRPSWVHGGAEASAPMDIPEEDVERGFEVSPENLM